MNDVLVIHPYRDGHGVWKFDDDSFKLRGEPFVGDINRMIDNMVRDARVIDARRGFTAYFSSAPLPGYHMRMEYLEGQATNGTTYTCDQYGLEGWLCPALRHYFGKSPAFIFVKAETRDGVSWFQRHCPLWRTA